jgi:D-alanine-D-alanine ligase
MSKANSHLCIMPNPSSPSKRTILLLCGGFSVEHEVSLNSARFIAQHIDKTEYRILVVIVRHDRQWIHIPYPVFLDGEHQGDPVYLRHHQGVTALIGDTICEPIHMVFPIIHGTGGEDGSIQGFLDYMNLPYVGNDIFASAACMDKIATKQILLANGLPVVPFIALSRSDTIPTYAAACRDLKSHVLVIKPATSGSSVGIAKVHQAKDYDETITRALMYANRILIECAITGAEVECAILGNACAMASGVGEIIVHNADKMYSYDAKYHDLQEKQAHVHVTAVTIDAETQERVRTMALRAFHVMTCSGLARIDFFVTSDGIFINELNTMPGFTAISLYPQLWQHEGISPDALIARLLSCAQERFDQNKTLIHHYTQGGRTEKDLAPGTLTC